eukprot:jgi/Picre1/30113/NNA_005482.t1
METVLNVAEKNSVAREVTRLLCRGQAAQDIPSCATYCRNFSFPFTLQGRQVNMVFSRLLDTCWSWTLWRRIILGGVVLRVFIRGSCGKAGLERRGREDKEELTETGTVSKDADFMAGLR